MRETDRLHMALRAHVSRVVLHAVDDAGAEQTADMQAHSGMPRTQVPVHYPFGFAAHVPHDGAVTHMLRAGGDPSDVVALPPSNPSVARFGDLPEGDSCLYDAVGQRVWLSGGRVVRVDAHTSMAVSVGGTTILQVTADGVSVTGNLSVSGGVTAKGDVKAGSISLEKHTHSGVETGSGSTGAPQ